MISDTPNILVWCHFVKINMNNNFNPSDLFRIENNFFALQKVSNNANVNRELERWSHVGALLPKKIIMSYCDTLI